MHSKISQPDYQPELPEIKNAYHEDDSRLKGKQEEKLPDDFYRQELTRLQVELLKMQEWIREHSYKLAIVFEGRDAAGKGGVIKAITKHLNPRQCRVAALPTPSEREKTQWYFQRYVAHLPSAGEIVLFDRSWYNRAGVEPVMGFCTEEEHQTFLQDCPQFEHQLIRSGIHLFKFWFSVSDKEQERRFHKRRENRHKHWKLSPIDLKSRTHWQEYSRAKDIMFEHTDTDQSPWLIVPSDDKARARLNCIAQILSCVPYEDIKPEVPDLPPLGKNPGYQRPNIKKQRFVPKRY